MKTVAVYARYSTDKQREGIDYVLAKYRKRK